MKESVTVFSRSWGVVLAVCLALNMACAGAALAGDNLEDLLVQVGEEYAKAYTSPFIEAFGPNQNSAMYQTAHIPWGGITFGVGVKVMGTHLNEDDQTFQKIVENVDLHELDPSLSGTGTVIFSGPTIFGDTNTKGTITVVPDAGGPPIALEGIPGLIDTRFVPMLAPEATLGGIFGLRATVRFFPEIDLSNYGKTKFLGFGLQWSPNGLLQNLPVDIMVGFFSQELKVGSLIDSDTSTYFAAVSKNLGVMTVYGGYAMEDSDMTVSYVQEDSGRSISFDASAGQESRLTLGARFGLLNAEMAHGDLTTYSAGLMLGF